MDNPFTGGRVGGAQPQQPNLAMQMLIPDAAVQQQQLMRKQALVEAMRQQAADNSTHYGGGWAIPHSAGQSISRLVDSLAANYQQSKIDDQQAALNQQTASALQRLANGDMSPAPAQTAAAPAASSGFMGGMVDALRRSLTGRGNAAVAMQPQAAPQAAGAPALGVPAAPQGAMPAQPVGQPQAAGGAQQPAPQQLRWLNPQAWTAATMLANMGIAGPLEVLKAEEQMYGQQPELQKLMRARDMLPPGSPDRAVLDAKIKNDATLLYRSGQTGVGPDGNIFTAPDTDKGIGITWHNGQPSAYAITNAAPIAAAQAGAVKGAEAAAQYPWQAALETHRGNVDAATHTVDVTLPTGAVVPVPRAAIINGQLPANLGAPPVGAPPAAPAAPATGAQPDPFEGMPMLPQPTGIGQGTYQKGLQEGAAKLSDKLGEDYTTRSEAANQRLQSLNDAMNVLPEANTGALALKKAAIQNFLQSNIGISPAALKPLLGGTSAATAELNKYLVNAGLQSARGIYGNRMTQNEVQLQLNQASPGVEMVPAAIKTLIATEQAKANYEIKKAQDYQQYLRKGGDPVGFEGWYSSRHPLADFVMNAPGTLRPGGAANAGGTAPTGAAAARLSPERAAQLRKIYGLPSE